MTLKIGIHAGQQDCKYEDLQRLWAMAEDAGVYWISLWDHFYDNPSLEGDGDCFEAVSMLSALASSTSKVRVGCLVFSTTYRNPAILAKIAATIDHISGGRLELGLGAGWFELEHLAYGIPFPPTGIRLDMLEEAVKIIKSMLTKDSTTFHGKHFSVENAVCNPKPIQNPPRIWIGGIGEKRTLRLAACYADGWNATYISPDDYNKKLKILERWCEFHGRNPAEITRTVNVGFYLGTDETKANNKKRLFHEKWGDKASEVAKGMLFGTPKNAVERIRQYEEAGADGLNIALRSPFDWSAIQAFLEEVLPVFHQG